MAPRADGATQADLAEATAMVVGGATMLFLPLLALMDRSHSSWLIVTGAASLFGAFVGGLGLRWFLTEGPALASGPAERDPALQAEPEVELPHTLKLVEARARFVAHILRFVALAALVLVVFVDLGRFNILALVAFGVSFVADHILLRPRAVEVRPEGLVRSGLFRREAVPWEDVQTVHWRHYPGKQQAPYPGGERVIVERESGHDLEFVFHRRYGGAAAVTLARAALPMLGERLRSLTPRAERLELPEPSVAGMIDRGEAAGPDAQT